MRENQGIRGRKERRRSAFGKIPDVLCSDQIKVCVCVCVCVSIFTSVFIALLICTQCVCLAGSLLWYVASPQHEPLD